MRTNSKKKSPNISYCLKIATTVLAVSGLSHIILHQFNPDLVAIISGGYIIGGLFMICGLAEQFGTGQEAI